MAAMGALTEVEIFSCLAENARLAAEDCDKLAKSPRKGPHYRCLLEHLESVEGCCRQASVWREDARWLRIGLYVAEMARRAGDWLRGVKVDKGPRRRIPPGQLHPLFVLAAGQLRMAYAKAIEFRDKAPPHLGMVLPKPLPGPHRDTRPISVALPPGMVKTDSGLIVPAGAMSQ